MRGIFIGIRYQGHFKRIAIQTNTNTKGEPVHIYINPKNIIEVTIQEGGE